MDRWQYWQAAAVAAAALAAEHAKAVGEHEKAKKWKERDKRLLLERVKEKYLDIRKMRFNLIKIDPMLNEERRYQRELKRLAKAKDKRRKRENQLQLELYNKQQAMETLSKRRAHGLRCRCLPRSGTLSAWASTGSS